MKKKQAHDIVLNNAPPGTIATYYASGQLVAWLEAGAGTVSHGGRVVHAFSDNNDKILGHGPGAELVFTATANNTTICVRPV